MIGQNKLKEYLTELIDADKLPRFIILVGDIGSGRKTLTKLLACKLGVSLYVCESGIDAIRKMISDANRINMPVMYLIPDADRLSLPAKNAILKVTEEPPKNAYFVMTLKNKANTLPTILSRGVTYNMDLYSAEEILDFANEASKYSINSAEKKLVERLCSTPGEVLAMLEFGIIDFYEYVEKVVDNIAEVSGTNAFKIADKIALKEADKEKYNLTLFWKIFMDICSARLQDDIEKYHKAIRITSKCLTELSILSINKTMLFDYWLLEIRREWLWTQAH